MPIGLHVVAEFTHIDFIAFFNQFWFDCLLDHITIRPGRNAKNNGFWIAAGVRPLEPKSQQPYG
jgi:hypothetical protein